MLGNEQIFLCCQNLCEIYHSPEKTESDEKYTYLTESKAHERTIFRHKRKFF